jgi:hypothetical protein
LQLASTFVERKVRLVAPHLVEQGARGLEALQGQLVQVQQGLVQQVLAQQRQPARPPRE